MEREGGKPGLNKLLFCVRFCPCISGLMSSSFGIYYAYSLPLDLSCRVCSENIFLKQKLNVSKLEEFQSHEKQAVLPKPGGVGVGIWQQREEKVGFLICVTNVEGSPASVLLV